MRRAIKLICRVSIIIFFIGTIILFNSGCMMLGMGAMCGKHMMHSSHKTEEKGTDINQMMDEALSRMAEKISNAEWQIESVAIRDLRTDSNINDNLLEDKLIVKLVRVGRFKVIDRKKLNVLLDEHELNLSGVTEKKDFPKIGELIGVDGFIDGTATLENDRLILTIKIVDTDTGEVIWEEKVMSGKSRVDAPTTQPEGHKH